MAFARADHALVPASFALRDSLSPSPKDKDPYGRHDAGPGSTSTAAKSLAGLTALWPCIYSARALLDSFVKLPKAHVRTAPGAPA